MATRTDDTADGGADGGERKRYAEVTRDAGDVLVYDTQNEDAWIQSDSAVDLARMA